MSAEKTAVALILASEGVRLPLRLCDEQPGSVLDADGMEILVIDQHNTFGDESVSAIALCIVDAVNRCAL